MPAPQGKMRGPKALRPYYDSTEVNGKRRKKAGNKQVQVPTFRKAFRGTTLPGRLYTIYILGNFVGHFRLLKQISMSNKYKTFTFVLLV